MAYEITYFRKYIILKKDYLNISNVNPKGHAKIEIKGTKGNVSINVEGCEEEKDYTVSLLRDKGGDVIEFSLGRIITDDKGRAKMNIPINLRDIEDEDFSIDNINAILIWKGKNILLSGYLDKDTGTIDRFVKKLILEKENIETITQYDKIQETTMEEQNIIEEVEEIEEETDTELTLEEYIVEEIQSGIGESPILDIEEIEYTENNIENKIDEQLEYRPQYEQEYEVDNYQSLEYIRRANHKNQMTNYILSILRFFPYVQPLKLNLHGYSWWRIDDDGTDSYKGFLPYFNYLMSANYKYPFLNNSTTCFDQIKKYGHYLFGIYKEDGETKYYIYGVPGKFASEEHPYKGITGFNTWYESTEDMGYWTLYIDPMTGKIIYPLNPMVPAY